MMIQPLHCQLVVSQYVVSHPEVYLILAALVGLDHLAIVVLCVCVLCVSVLFVCVVCVWGAAFGAHKSSNQRRERMLANKQASECAIKKAPASHMACMA